MLVDGCWRGWGCEFVNGVRNVELLGNVRCEWETYRCATVALLLLILNVVVVWYRGVRESLNSCVAIMNARNHPLDRTS
jgi:hypothetical protein